MLPSAATAARCGSYLFYFGAYEWIITLLSLRCVCILKARTAGTVQPGGTASSSIGGKYHVAIFGNLVSLPAAAAIAACDADFVILGASFFVVSLLSLACALILRNDMTKGRLRVETRT